MVCWGREYLSIILFSTECLLGKRVFVNPLISMVRGGWGGGKKPPPSLSFFKNKVMIKIYDSNAVYFFSPSAEL